jgi:DNA replication protein DnaC
MRDHIEESIRDRLSRLAGRVGGVERPRVCALTGSCPKCTQFKGVQLFGDKSTITASLCDCIRGCFVCSGSGMRPSTAQTPSGKVTPSLKSDLISTVEPCMSPSPKKIAGIINEARIPSRYLEAELSKFEGFNPADRTQKTTITNWLRGLKPGKSSGLLLSGPVGIGKSWLLAAMAKHLAFQGFSVRYADFFQLVHELREAYASDQSDKSSLKPLQNVDVLIIDELGKGRNTEWELSVADSLISDRYNGNKCIIAATNYPLRSNTQEQRQIDYLRSEPATNQMNTTAFEPLAQRIGTRMFSRLSENCICMELIGSDRRRR